MEKLRELNKIKDFRKEKWLILVSWFYLKYMKGSFATPLLGG
jgi:hypothetical protein